MGTRLLSEQPCLDGATHPPRAAILEELPGASLLDFEFEDMEDASLAALSADPERVLEAGETGATSYFERMHRDHSDELQEGLARLREDIAAGRAPRRAGRPRCSAGRSVRRLRLQLAPRPARFSRAIKP